MSDLAFCQKNYPKFSELKKELKKILEEKIGKIKKENLIDSEKGIYLGLSIYKQDLEGNSNSYYNVYYSLALYSNENEMLSVSENDFSGFVFDEIKLSKEDEVVHNRKKHKYLKIFFQDIHPDLITDSEINYFSKTLGLENNYVVQLYLIIPYELAQKNKDGIIEVLNDIKNEKIFKCIPKSDIKMILKRGMQILDKEIILIIDLARTDKRKNKKYENMDSVLTSKIIYVLNNIAGIYNFKTINHTGDGFVFIYRREKENIWYDIKLLIENVEKKMNDFKSFLEGLNEISTDYKVRAIISECKTLYEIDYMNDIDKKLYFSIYLDMIFEKVFSTKGYENECFKKSNTLFLIDKKVFELLIKTDKFDLCEEKGQNAYDDFYIICGKKTNNERL